MPYFQNVFDSKFIGVWVLSDRQFSVNFSVNGDVNTSRWMVPWNPEPYDLTTNNTLTFNYSFDFKNFTPLGIVISTGAADVAAVRAYEIAAALNADPTFSALMLAYAEVEKGYNLLKIRALRTRPDWRVYISGTSAEKVLGFNNKSGVAQLPTYFARHTIANANNYPDSVGMLQQLDPTTTQDQQIINKAGLSSVVGLTNASPTVPMGNTNSFAVGDSIVIYNGTTTVSATVSSMIANTSLTLSGNWTGTTGDTYLVDVKTDYQLLRGRSGLFNFQKIVVDGSDRMTSIIEYPAGAMSGDLGRKIAYTYTGTNTHPTQITEIPYTLTTGDLVIP